MKVVVTEYDMLTPYGAGVESCWNGLISSQSALKKVDRFDVAEFQSSLGGCVSGVDSAVSQSACYQLVDMLFRGKDSPVPVNTPLFLATTTGEVDLIERSVLSGNSDYSCGALHVFRDKISERIKARWGTQLISSACISSTAAVALAASKIRSGQHDACFVVGCDALSEFVFSGFSSLMALDASGAHPFDQHRRGLCVGEGAAYVVLMSQARAIREGLEILGEIKGWGLSNDANHMTGPSRDGAGLARAIAIALKLSGLDSRDVGAICAHGTGTQYNDAMEMQAFKSVFSNVTPVFSIKGGTGHTMGAAGLVELLITLHSLQSHVVAPTVGLSDVDELAAGWVSSSPVSFSGECCLTVNSGFGGVNAALVVGDGGGMA